MYLPLFVYYRCTQASICHTPSILQHLSTAGIYIPPTYNSPPLCWPMRPIISYQAPHPHLPIPMPVLLLLVFVLTCVLLIPFPNPGLGYRAAEKPDPLLSSSPSRYLARSLSLITQLCCNCSGKVKWTLYFIQIARPDFIYLFLTHSDFFFFKSHEMQLL